MDSDRFYSIQSYPDGFVTGTCDDGQQVVMGLLCPHLVAYFFDRGGNFLRDEHRPWNTPAPRCNDGGPYDIYDGRFRDALDAQQREWQDAMGFRSGTIRIRAFFDVRHHVGISDLPGYMEDEAIADHEGEERTDREKLRTEWIRDGSFVWWWAQDYWMSRNGEVEST